MDYAITITTEHSTYTQSAPKRTALKLTRGRLAGGWLHFPPGPAGKLHIQIWQANHQIAPATPGESYALDDAIAPLDLSQDLDQKPYTIYIHTWNTSTTYDHACTVSLYLRTPPKKQTPKTIWQKIFKRP